MSQKQAIENENANTNTAVEFDCVETVCDAEPNNNQALIFEMEIEIHRTINMLGLLSDTVMNYAETIEDVNAQEAFFGLRAVLGDRAAALVALSDRF